MNLAFLSPCRQPDRIDSTLTIPQVLHPPRPSLSTTTTTTSGKTAAATNFPSNQQRRRRRRRQRHRRLSAVSSCTSSSSTSNSTMTSRRNGDNEEEEEKDDSERGKELSTDDVGNGDVDTDEYTSENIIDQNENTTASTNFEDEKEDEEDEEESCYWTACYAVSFHRRGDFLASGHASGLVAVHDFLGRNLSALYWPPPPIALRDDKTQKMNGCATFKSFYFGYHENGSNNSTAWSGDSDQHQLGKKTKNNRNNNNNNNKSEIGKMSTRNGKQQKKTTEKSSSSGEEESTSNNDKSSTLATTSITDYYDENNDSSSSMENYHHQQRQQLVYKNGVTSVSWDRHGKTLLAGAIGDRNLRLMDNTHPLVATDCADAVRRQFFANNCDGGTGKKNPKYNGDDDDHDETPSALEIKKASVIAKCLPLMATLSTDNSEEEGKHESIAIRMDTVSLGRARLLSSNIIGKVKMGISSADCTTAHTDDKAIASSSLMATPCTTSEENIMSVPTRRHPTLVLQLPQPLGGPAQLHPRESHVGLACMMDGGLALFYLPPTAYYEALPSLLLNRDTSEVAIPSKMMVDYDNDDDADDNNNKQKQWAIDALMAIERKRVGNLVFLVPPPSPESNQAPHYFITCATFGKDGDIVWAVTKCGTLLAFRIDPPMMSQLRGDDKDNASTPIMQPTLCANIPGGTAAYQIIVSRNGKLLLINSADCSLRLYSVEDLREKFDVGGIGVIRENDPGTESDEKRTNITNVSPRFVFQDNISKAPWASCDFSGDGELVVGGCNSYPQPGDSYKLFLWNCVTGELVDQLTGPISSLYSVSCHPTRPFIAVGTSDDLIDVWGSRIDWVAFAPDFQALQQNELYEEREDEFDVVDDEDDEEECTDEKLSSSSNQIPSDAESVDIMTIEKIPAYSDSEDETPVFYFDTKVMKILSE